MTARKKTTTAEALALVPKLRELGVVHYEADGVRLVLGPLPSKQETSTADTRREPKDALATALELRRPEPTDPAAGSKD